MNTTTVVTIVRAKLTAFTIFALILLSFSAVIAAPKIVIPESTFNFGKAPQKATVSHTFWIKSTGDDTLKVEKIVPGCGCTQMPLRDSVLAPGDSAELEILFSTKSYRGFVSKRPYITTNAGEEKVYLRIDIEILPEPELMRPIRFNPYILDVSQFTVEPRRKARAWVINQSDIELELNLIDDMGKDFTVELPNVVKARDSVELLITVNEDAIEKEFNQSVTIETNDEGVSRYSLPIQRKYRAPRAEKVDDK